MRHSTLALSLLFLVSCASGGNIAVADDDKPTFIASRTMVSDQADATCSLTITPLGEPELGLLTSLAAPFLYNLASSGFDALGSAITSAAEAKTKSHTPPKQPITLVTSTENTSVSPSDLELVRRPACIRTVYGRFNMDAGSEAGVDEFGLIDIGEFEDAEKLEDAITPAIDKFLPGSVEEIFFYSEHWLEPIEGAAGKHYYRVVPVVLWYNKPTQGPRYKLTSLSLSMQAPGVTDDSSVLSYSQTFEPEGLSSGTIFTYDTGGLVESGFIPAPAFSETETKAIAAIKTARSTYITSNEDRILASTNDAYGNAVAELASKEADLKLLKCYAAAAGNQAKIDICNATKAVDEYKRDEVTAVLADAKNTSALVRISDEISGFGEQLGHYNIGASFTESRAANEFFLAIGKAISDSKTERDEILKTYVNSQLGVTEDASNLTALNEYRSAKLKYDIALRKYNEAQLEGDQDKIDTALTELVTHYNGLTTAAASAGIPVTEPDPYP